MPPTSRAPAKTAAASAMSPGLIVLLLSLLLGLQPVTTDLYLPALPALTEGFGASMAQAQLTLTALLLSFGLSQLVWGPLSDRFGRRPVLLWGMVAYVAASVGSALAASMDLLIVWRTVQGAAMGAGVMAARAVVRDLYQPVDAARAMSKGLSGLGVIACASAPLGGLLSDLFGWRATLLGVAVFGAATLALIALRFEETMPPANRRALHPASLAKTCFFWSFYWGQTPISLRLTSRPSLQQIQPADHTRSAVPLAPPAHPPESRFAPHPPRQPMPTQPSADGIFTTSRLFPFTPAQIFAAFADAERLATWWGPDGFSNTFEVFEFKPQGRWTFVMHGQDGTHYANDCTFLEASPQRIVIRHVTVPHFTLTITLTEANGQTRLAWRQAFDDPRVATAAAPIVVPANEQNLNRLQAVLLASAESSASQAEP